ncbi:mediator complex, subunit Med16 [Phaeosphaeriaceae sp. PMI808]|nr:mediator complex, subunit Med16 [Phaeosphaeriaceae sp. PMI808]
MDPTYNMDVDDLFGDSEHVNLQNITTTPAVKGLAKKLDDLGASGCCQKIAWSKNGCVAHISPDGYTINLKVFSRDTDTGKWDLRKDVPLKVPQGREEFPFVHLSWSHLGTDLAVMDAAGRVMVFSSAMALDRMQFIRAELAHPEAEVDGVVGMHWLGIIPYEARNSIVWSTTRAGKKRSWNIKQYTFKHASHPINSKAALIYLKRYGELKLRFQQSDSSSWQEVSAQLGPMISTKEPFTHAAFASNNDNNLLLAAYDVAQRLHLYKVEPVWNVPENRAADAGPIEKPVLHVSLISTEDDCNPINLVDSDISNGIELRDKITAKLTHLNFLPITPEEDIETLPTIQAIFCHPPNVISFDQLQPQEPLHSVIVRWEVHQTSALQQQRLHPTLDQVTSKKKSISSVKESESSFKLKRLPDFSLHSVVLNFHSLWFNMLLAFSYGDGTIEFRKRSTMETIMPDGNTDFITSLLQAGFVFPPAEPSVHVAFSPSNCMAVCMQQDGTIKLRSMEYQHGTLSTDDDDPRHSAALAALALQSSSAANQYCSSDDIFAVMGPLTEKRINDFTNLLFDGLQVNVDCGIDDQNNHYLTLLGRAPFFVKTLSAMNLLGLQRTTNRSVTSKIAWMILNIKYVTQILTTIVRMHGAVERMHLRPEIVPQFVGICRWVMHTMAYILDELFTLGRAVEDIPSASLTREVLEQKIHELNRPAVLLLLSAFPRAMMKLWTQPIAWIKRSADIYTNPAHPTPSPDIRKVYTPLQTAISEIPFEWRWFEYLLTETQNTVRGLYKRANVSETQRNLYERELILGRVPDLLFPVAKRLVTDSLWNTDKTQGTCLADRLDVGELMFFDTTWLGFQHSNRGAEWHETHVVDVCQKLIIRGTGTHEHPSLPAQQARSRSDSGEVGARKKPGLRRCVRCGAYMEDVGQGSPGYAHNHVSWLMGVAKHCICGCPWTLAPEKKRAR